MTLRDSKLKKGKTKDPEIIAWCSYCKDAIYEEDEYVKNNGSVHHLDCWKQKNNVIEELNLDS